MAEVGAGLPPSVSVISGVDPRTSKPFINQIFLGATAGAASPHNDAWLTYLHAGNAGLRSSTASNWTSFISRSWSSAPYHSDTEGPGRHRGAPSLYVEFGPVDCEVEVAFVSDGVFNPPLGARGGGTGGGARQYKVARDGSMFRSIRRRRQTGPWRDHVAITCGGGGYGDPASRDPARVLRDVRKAGSPTNGRLRSIKSLLTRMIDSTSPAPRRLGPELVATTGTRRAASQNRSQLPTGCDGGEVTIDGSSPSPPSLPSSSISFFGCLLVQLKHPSRGARNLGGQRAKTHDNTSNVNRLRLSVQPRGLDF